MAEIPKDGKTYLAWHEEGFKLVYGSHIGYHYYEVDNPVGYDPSEFSRWMDEKGQWHEVKDERL